MCGIFGAIGNDCVKITLNSLKNLEYRGYDSAGVSVKSAGVLNAEKVVGRSGQLSYAEEKYPEAVSCIGHTRWATHGEVAKRNAHPFVSFGGNFAIVHNGILDNWREIKKNLQANGIEFSSDTDSEVIAHLLEANYSGNVLEDIRKTMKCLEGSFAVAVQTTFDDNLYVFKRKSPLVAGKGLSGLYVCSDVRCLSCYAEQAAVLADDTVAEIGHDIKVYDERGEVTCRYFSVKKTDFAVPEEDIMFSEICEIPCKIRAAKNGYIKNGRIGLSAKKLRGFNRIYLLGCGTAYHSGLQTAAVARKFVDVDVIPVVASEFVYDNYPVDERTLAFCISQSGETADTIKSAEVVKARGGFAYAVTNTDESSLVYKCDKSVNVCAGGEFAVASTKAYNCQLVTLLLLFADIAVARCMPASFLRKVERQIDRAACATAAVLQSAAKTEAVAEWVQDCSSVFFLGRTTDYPTAAEGALKMKEITYKHCEAYPSGELKHGPLALMEKGVCVVALSTDLNLSERTEATLAEASGRGARTLCVSPYAIGAERISLPVTGSLVTGIVSVVPLQLLAYYVAKKLGRDIDKPRNLAKSVTVE